MPIKLIKKPFIVVALLSFLIGACLYAAIQKRQLSNTNQTPAEFIVTAQVLESVLLVTGVIQAGSSHAVIAPFNGIVQEKSFSVDHVVEKGQTLMVLNTQEIAMQVDEAKIAMLKAAQGRDALQNWDKSSEMARASRAVLSAKLSLEETQRKINESEILLKRGIIPRSEYEALLEQARNQDIQLASANDDLKSVTEKSSLINQQIARIESDNARHKYADLTHQLENNIIKAPAAGVVAQASTSNNVAAIELGSHVTKGQPLLNILPLADLEVSATVNEADVLKLSQNQAVNISLDAQDAAPMLGKISRISAQALPNLGGPKTAQFEIKVKIPSLNEAALKNMRVGMTCNLSIIKYRNPHAMVVPLNFVQQENGKSYLWLKSKVLKKQSITLGHTTEQGVEVLTGLNVGDTITLPNQPSA